MLARDVGIRFNGVEKNNVEEYCVSEGWIRVAAGKAMDRFGNPLTIKLKGTVEPYFRDKKKRSGEPAGAGRASACGVATGRDTRAGGASRRSRTHPHDSA